MKERILNEIKRAIKIARLDVKEQEFIDDIFNIIKMFDKISEFNKDEKISVLPIKIENQLRDDNEKSIEWDIKNKRALSWGPKI